MTAHDDLRRSLEPEAADNGTARLVDAKAMAAMLDVPSSWLLAQARRDAVPHVRLGRYVRFAPADVLAWASSRSRGPRADIS
jgi:hypothetical protein